VTTAAATAFGAERPRLWAVAYRMLGSVADAEDAVQTVLAALAREPEIAVTGQRDGA